MLVTNVAPEWTRTMVLLAVMAATLVVASRVALAVTKAGTNDPDTLNGTDGSDDLIDRGGHNTRFSRAGNDTQPGGRAKIDSSEVRKSVVPSAPKVATRPWPAGTATTTLSVAATPTP
jgi:hypothetical protein